MKVKFQEDQYFWSLKFSDVMWKPAILLQIALRKTRRVRRAWSWPRKQFRFETLLNGKFVECWKENLRISRRTFENVIEWDWRNPDTGCKINSMRPQADVSVIQTLVPTLTMPARRVNRTFTLVNFLLSWVVFTRVSVGVYTRKIF